MHMPAENQTSLESCKPIETNFHMLEHFHHLSACFLLVGQEKLAGDQALSVVVAETAAAAIYTIHT